MGGLPDHAAAVADWLWGDDAFGSGWVDAHCDGTRTFVTLHVGNDVHEDRREVLAFRARIALRRFDPQLTGLTLTVAADLPDAPARR